jgi:hypothetical protein
MSTPDMGPPDNGPPGYFTLWVSPAVPAVLAGDCPPLARFTGQGCELEQYVTLDQMAAIVGRSKPTLRRYVKQAPKPTFRGRRGQAGEWRWSDVRPWLEATFGRKLPERFPSFYGTA